MQIKKMFHIDHSEYLTRQALAALPDVDDGVGGEGAKFLVGPHAVEAHAGYRHPRVASGKALADLFAGRRNRNYRLPLR